MAANARHGAALFSRPTATEGAAALCDINITPLIDVMLVLLVTLIITLPITTHAVNMDMPQAPAALPADPPESINLEIESDGVVVLNGRALDSLQQLESYLLTAAQKVPQPEIHLHADRGVKYDYVAQVLALVQRCHMLKMGFVNTAEFGD